MMTEKEEIKDKLKKLKTIGVTRDEVAEHFHLAPGYVNQMVGKSGKVPPYFFPRFNQFFDDQMKIAPINAPAPATLKKGKGRPGNTLYIQRKDESAFSEYARRMAAAEYFHEVEGDAMHPAIQRGDGLLIVEIEKEIIVGGEPYVVELNNGLTVVRFVKFDVEDPQKLWLVSFNKTAGDTAVFRSDVRRLFKILLKISK